MRAVKINLKYLAGGITLVAMLASLSGCTTISNSGTQTFATGVANAKTQTDTALQAITDLTSEAIIEYAASQPTLNDTNFMPVIDAPSLAVWDNVFTALQKYGQNLTALTSPDSTKAYEDASVALAAELTAAGNDLKAQKVTSQGAPSAPSIAAAFTELGDLFLREKAQHDAKKIIAQSDPAIQMIFTNMAATIGTAQTNGLRGTVYANWEERKAEQQVAYLSAKAADRVTIATKYASLLNSEVTQDLALDALNKSLLALANAHHALAKGDATGVASAVSFVEQELQRTTDLMGRFQTAAKGAK